jgi:uncharacterized protein (DUF1778 family)
MPRPDPSVRLDIRLPLSLREAVAEAAEDRGETASDFWRRAALRELQRVGRAAAALYRERAGLRRP